MGMSKEVQERLANIVSDIPDCETRKLVGEEVADLCEEENPSEFDKDSFLEACIGDDCQKGEEEEQLDPEDQEDLVIAALEETEKED